ncbi:MAG: sulfur carrier protein ThiS [Blastocatellia bacterium]
MSNSPVIEIVVNGEPHRIAPESTVTDLVTQLDLPSARLAIELNREILPRQQWPSRKLQSGDRLEVVHFVGGG